MHIMAYHTNLPFSRVSARLGLSFLYHFCLSILASSASGLISLIYCTVEYCVVQIKFYTSVLQNAPKKVIIAIANHNNRVVSSFLMIKEPPLPPEQIYSYALSGAVSSPWIFDNF